MEKSPEAFRTISEVADLLDTPAHVLRFWESRFPQIRPVKRAGGRRYYRPGDVALLSGIKRLLHDDGMTIRGVQKILREHGVRHVAGLTGPDTPDPAGDDVEAVLVAEFGAPPPREQSEPAVAQTAQIISLEKALARVEPEPDRQSSPAVSTDGPVGPEQERVSDAPFWTDEIESAEPGEPVDSPNEAGNSPVAQAGSPQTQHDEVDSRPAAILRKMSKATLVARRVELTALHARLTDLRERLAQASRRRAR